MQKKTDRQIVNGVSYEIMDSPVRNAFENKCLESNVLYFATIAEPSWKEVYFFKQYSIGENESRVFYVEFEETPAGSTYITLADGHDNIKYQTQCRGTKSFSFTFLADDDYTDLALWVSGDTYSKMVSVQMKDPYKAGSAEAVANRADCIAKEKTGYYSLARLGEFCNGIYYYPEKRFYTYGVASVSPMTAPKDLYIRVSAGYEARAYIISDGTASDTGWQQTSMYIPAGSEFVISIEKQNPNTSETVDVAELVNKLIILDADTSIWNDGKYFADFWQSGKNIAWATGEIQSAGCYWDLYTFKNPLFKRIRVYGSVYGRSIAEIAFYSTETPTTSSYIQSASAQPGSWDEVHWTEAEVPENCKCACVTSRNIKDGGTHEIQILIDGIENYTLNLQSERNAGINLMSDKSFKYIYHINADHLGESEIPSQSLSDIEMAHRLGFKVYELNAHPTATEGKYVCIHGVNGKIGSELIDKNGDDISNISFGDVDYETYLNDYIYNTPDSKYATHVTFLDEALALCKKYKMIPMVSWSNYEMIDYVRKICGNDFILLVYNEYYIRRALYKGTYSIYKSLTAEQLKSLIAETGAPFIYNLTTDQTSLTDEQIREIINVCHSNGCTVGFAGVYQTYAQNERFLKLGADIMSSGWDVEYFENGGLMSLHDNNTFEDFYHGGTVGDGVLTLEDGDYLSSQYADDPAVLSKGILTIRFNGTIKITMGNYINEVSITSDGTDYKQLSTAFYKLRPNFTVQSVGRTEVYNCIYDASIC